MSTISDWNCPHCGKKLWYTDDPEQESPLADTVEFFCKTCGWWGTEDSFVEDEDEFDEDED